MTLPASDFLKKFKISAHGKVSFANWRVCQFVKGDIRILKNDNVKNKE